MSGRGIKPVVRTLAGLRDALFDALDALRNGEIEPQEAKATATVAQQIVNTVELELEVHKMRREYPADARDQHFVQCLDEAKAAISKKRMLTSA